MVPSAQGSDGAIVHDGELEAAISTAMVQMLHRYTGRGPTRARTTIGEDVIVCVMGATLTRGERTLVDHEYEGVVLRAREAFQDIMKREAIEMVEQLTGRTVIAFMSSTHIAPDVAAEVFVLLPRSRHET